MFDAVWIYDINKRKIIKNKTGKAMLVHLGVPEVSRDYLRELGYIRPIMSGSSGSGLFGP